MEKIIDGIKKNNYNQYISCDDEGWNPLAV